MLQTPPVRGHAALLEAQLLPRGLEVHIAGLGANCTGRLGRTSVAPTGTWCWTTSRKVFSSLTCTSLRSIRSMPPLWPTSRWWPTRLGSRIRIASGGGERDSTHPVHRAQGPALRESRVAKVSVLACQRCDGVVIPSPSEVRHFSPAVMASDLLPADQWPAVAFSMLAVTGLTVLQ